MTRRDRRGFSLAEVLIAFALASVIFVILWNVFGAGSRNRERASDRLMALSHAQLALEELNTDLFAMAPPNPYLGDSFLKISADGRSLAFFRNLDEGKRMAAEPVAFEARPTPRGNLHLYRNGRLVKGVLLKEFRAKVTTRPEAAPVLEISIVGISKDIPAADVRIRHIHALHLNVPCPDVSPSAMVGLPMAAHVILGQAEYLKGSLPQI